MFGNLIEQLVSSGLLKKVNSTPAPTNNDLNNSPRPLDINQPRAVPFSGQGGTGSAADINQPRTAQFAGANVNANTYGKSNENIFKDLVKFKKGGEILARGNKLAKHRSTKLY
jgi:hypothetical protein